MLIYYAVLQGEPGLPGPRGPEGAPGIGIQGEKARNFMFIVSGMIMPK